jgi:hypothetical protein
MNAHERVWAQYPQKMTIRIHPYVTRNRGEYGDEIEVFLNSKVVHTVNWMDHSVGIWDMRLGLPRGIHHKHVFYIVKEKVAIALDPFKTWAQNGVVAGTVVHRIRPSALIRYAAEAA